MGQHTSDRCWLGQKLSYGRRGVSILSFDFVMSYESLVVITSTIGVDKIEVLLITPVQLCTIHAIWTQKVSKGVHSGCIS